MPCRHELCVYVKGSKPLKNVNIHSRWTKEYFDINKLPKIETEDDEEEEEKEGNQVSIEEEKAEDEEEGRIEESQYNNNEEVKAIIDKVTLFSSNLFSFSQLFQHLSLNNLN